MFDIQRGALGSYAAVSQILKMPKRPSCIASQGSAAAKPGKVADVLCVLPDASESEHQSLAVEKWLKLADDALGNATKRKKA